MRKGYEERNKDMISSGRTKIVCTYFGLKVYWNDAEITKGVGLNTAVNTLGMWTDSSKADWQILEKGDNFILKNHWKDLPIIQVWKIKIKDEAQIYWQVEMEVKEDLVIDEKRTVILVSPRYQGWINSNEQGRFPKISEWQGMPLKNLSSRCVGVNFPTGGDFLPSLLLDFKQNRFGQILPLIQNTSSSIYAHIIGVRSFDNKRKRYYLPGNYSFFSGEITLFKNEELLDKRIEEFRGQFPKGVEAPLPTRKKIRRAGRLKVVLANMPWQRNGLWGVRAGSRWPHIKDISEGNYLPFPFFLAYAASLLRRNEIDVTLIDAIAEQIPEDKFIEDLSRRDFDILVTETSIPSFYYDIKLLKKLSSLDIFIVLCGAHTEIYRPEFLEKNNFIDFVLFGEYEFTLLELIKAISKGKRNLSFIKGLIWRDNKNNVVKNSSRSPFDINLLPWPYRDALPMRKYWDLPGDIPYPSVQMIASRGCPFGCNFCLWPQVLFGGKTYRTRDIKDCIDEMQFLVTEKKFKSIYFDDDTFNIGKERMLKFCDEIIKRDLNKVPWAIMAKADLMDEQILDKMKKAGLYAVKYGVESASQKLVDRCGKYLDLKKTERIIGYTRSLGIRLHLTFSFGLLGETEETVKKTIDYALKLDPHSVQFSINTPFPGTMLFEELDGKGKILTYDWSLYDGHNSCVFQPDNLSPSDLEKAKGYAYRSWADYKRRKRGFKGDLKRFKDYLKKNGLKFTIYKTIGYLNFIWIKRKRYLDGKI